MSNGMDPRALAILRDPRFNQLSEEEKRELLTRAQYGQGSQYQQAQVPPTSAQSPTLPEIWKKLNSDPRMAYLSYQEQVELRTKWLLQNMEKDPRFGQLAIQEKDAMLRRMAYMPPAWSDPAYGAQFTQLGEQIKAFVGAGGDPYNEDPNNPVRKAMGLLSGESGRAQSSIANAVTMGGRMLRSGLVPGMGQAALQVGAAATAAVPDLKADDRTKAAEYMKYIMSSELQMERQVRVAETLGTVGGFALDLLGYYAATGMGAPSKMAAEALTRGATGRAVQALAGRLPTLAKAASGIMRSAATFVPQTVGEGIVGVVRENVLRAEQGRPTSWDMAKPVGDIVNVFGEYAALDFAVGALLNTGGKLAGSVMRVMGRGYERMGEFERALRVAGAGSDDLSDLITNVMTGGHISQDALQRLPDVQRIHIENAREILTAASRQGMAAIDDPVLKTKLAAFNSHYLYEVAPDGKWTFRRLWDLDAAPIVRTDLTSANTFIADDMERATRAMKPEDVAKWRAGKYWITPFVDMPHYVDEVLDTKRLVKDIESSYRGASPELAAKARFEAAKWSKMVNREAYVSPVARSVIDSTEAGLFMRTAPREAVFTGMTKVNLGPDDVLDAVRTGRPLFDDSTSLRLTASPDPTTNNALVVMRKPATHDEWVAAGALAETRIMKDGLPYTKADVTRYMLIDRGYDGVLHSPTEVEMFFPSRLRVVDDRLNPLTGKFGLDVLKGKKPVPGMATKAEVMITLEGTLPAGTKVRAGAVASALGPIGGPLNRDELLEFARTYYRAQGVEPGKLNIIIDPSIKTTPELRSGMGEMQILAIPERIDTPQARQEFTSRFVDSLQVMVNTKRGTPLPTTVAGLRKDLLGGRVVQSYERQYSRFRMPVSSAADQKTWLQHIVARTGGTVEFPATGARVTLKGGGPVDYRTVEEAADSVLLAHTTQRDLDIAFQEQGMFIRRTGSGETAKFQVYDAGGKPIQGWTGSTPGDVFQASGVRPKLDGDRFGPKFVVMDAATRRIRYSGDVFVGGPEATLQYLDQFHSNKERTLGKVFRVGDASITRSFNAQVSIHLPWSGVRMDFDNIPEAIRYVNTDWKKQNELIRTARRKGWELFATPDGFRVVGPDGSRTAKDLDGLSELLRSRPDPGWAPDLADTANASSEVRGAIENMNYTPAPRAAPSAHAVPPQVDPVRRQPIREAYRKAKHAFAPRRDYLDGEAARLGLDDLAGRIVDADKGATMWANDASMGEKLIDRIMRDGRGRLHPLERRVLLWDYMQVPSDMQAKFAEVHKLTGDEIATAKSARQWFDQAFVRLGLDPKTFIEGYLPRIRDEFLSMSAQKSQASVMAEDFVKSIWGEGKVPKEVQWWATHKRMDEVAMELYDRDILSIMQRYNMQGTRRFWLEPTFRPLANAVNATDSPLPQAMKDNIMRWRDQLMGVDHTYMEKVLRSGLDEFIRRIPQDGSLTPLQMAKEVAKLRKGMHAPLERLFSISYMSSIGLRPWSGFKNMTQAFTVLGTRFGMGPTLRAVNQVFDYGQEMYEFVRAKGMVSGRAPIVDIFSGEGGMFDRGLSKATQASLTWMTNADEWSRMIGWQVAKNKWDDAVNVYQAKMLREGKPFDMDHFMVFTDANLLGAGAQNRIRSLAAQGKFEGALDAYATEIVNDTLFAVRKAQKPLAFTGLVGKLFGQFGIYSSNYVQHIVKGLTRGTPAQIMGFVTRTAATSFAMYHGFKAMGIDEDDFLAYVPMAFAGGPMAGLMLTAWKAALGQGYEARQARAELDRYLPMDLATFAGQYMKRVGEVVEGEDSGGTPMSLAELAKTLHWPAGFTPGYYEIMSIMRAREYLDKGDTVRAILALTGAPLVPEGN